MMAQKVLAIDFTSYIAERTTNFTGREWVFKAVNDWLSDPDGARFFFLKGEPDSGKTAISARLSQFSQGVFQSCGLSHLTPGFLSAIHFCSARDTTWIDPLVFAGSLATQLASRYPAYLKLLEDLHEEKQIEINVKQNVQEVVNGQMIGVVINVKGPSPESAFNRVVREPLKALLDGGMNEQVVILVNALDEALSFSGTPTIVSLLAKTAQLSQQVRFILTSRLEERVESQFLEVKELSISIPGDQRNQDDIRRYVEGRLQKDLQLAEKAGQVEPAHVAELVEVVSGKAEGNFLYVSFLLDVMAKGLRSLTELDGLPIGLDWLYFDSLRRVVDLGKRDWFNEYRPLMGVLSVAQAGLTQAELAAFTGQSESDIWEALSDLQQFIEEGRKEKNGKTRYHLYHQSVIDFLHLQRLVIKEKRLRNTYYLSAEEWHTKIIDHYRAGTAEMELVNWRRVDDYGLLYLASPLHALKGVEIYRQLLYKLVCKSLMLEKRTRYGSHQPFAADVALAIDAALSENPPNMVQVSRGCLIYGTLGSLATNVPLGILWALAIVGQVTKATSIATLMHDAMKRSRAYQVIGEVLLTQKVWEEARAVLEQAIAAAEAIDSERDKAAEIGQIALSLAEAEQYDQALEVAQAIGHEEIKAYALRNVARALLKAGEKARAETVTNQALKVAEKIKHGDSKVDALTEIVLLLAQQGEKVRAGNVVAQALVVSPV